MTGTSHSITSKLQTTHSHLMVQNTLSSNELEFYELSCSCGLAMNPQVFKILVDLIRLDVSPSAIFTMLENMSSSLSASNQARSSSSTSRSSSSQSHKQRRDNSKARKGSSNQDIQ